MRAKATRLPIVEVLWWDSTQHSNGWQDPGDYTAKHARGLMRCRTAGYLLADDETGVMVVQSLTDDEVAEGMSIPRAVITRIRRL